MWLVASCVAPSPEAYQIKLRNASSRLPFQSQSKPINDLHVLHYSGTVAMTYKSSIRASGGRGIATPDCFCDMLLRGAISLVDRSIDPTE